MNQKIIESVYNDNYPIKNAKDMSLEEMSRWYALLNALKFINHTSELTGIQVKEKDIDYREISTYIDSVGGDIETHIREIRGIPFKYSLTTEDEESLNLNDLKYEYLA